MHQTWVRVQLDCICTSLAVRASEAVLATAAVAWAKKRLIAGLLAVRAADISACKCARSVGHCENTIAQTIHSSDMQIAMKTLSVTVTFLMHRHTQRKTVCSRQTHNGNVFVGGDLPSEVHHFGAGGQCPCAWQDCR